MQEIKFKVCGMRDPENIRKITDHGPDYLGFIFYRQSPRYAGEYLVHEVHEVLKDLPGSIKKVGVFVNEDLEEILRIVDIYTLDLVQLHGDEDPDFCRDLKKKDLKIIKAIPIQSKKDFDKCAAYENVVDYFLFDTKGKYYGGNNRKFDWSLLDDYKMSEPYFLSGGIGIEDINNIMTFTDKRLYAIDVNSGFEIKPGLKDPEKVKEAIKVIKSMRYGGFISG